ncbi:MAG: DinB family protein [Aggregatilineales bacterium]
MNFHDKVRRTHVRLMRLSLETLEHILKNTTQEQATTLRDGLEGWTILEVVCHLRDFDGFFYDRAVMMVEQDNPQLPAHDHEALAIERDYNSQNLAYAFDELKQSRERFREFFKNLTAEQWERAGIHPEKGHFTITDAAIQVGMHDVTHLEQITRILEQEVPGSGALPSE